MKHARLPNKPSELIRVAIRDLAKCERMPEKYRICMWAYHVFESDIGICRVCLAGSTMAQTLNAPFTKDMNPDDYDRDTALKQEALDALRRYNYYPLINLIPKSRYALKFMLLLSELGYFGAKLSKTSSRKAYDESPLIFKRNMLQYASIFAKYGF